MRWVTHQVGALAAGLWLGLPASGLAAAWLGGIFPDVMDQKAAGLFRNRQKGFNRVHRGFSHWPGLWLAGFFATLCFLPEQMNFALRPVLTGFFIGGLSHVVLDMLTVQGIPLRPFSRKNRLSLNLCKTGGIGEYVFLATMALCICLFFNDRVYFMARQLLRAASTL